MALVKFTKAGSEDAIYVNARMVVTVEASGDGKTFIVTVADANGLHIVHVEEPQNIVVSRLATAGA